MPLDPLKLYKSEQVNRDYIANVVANPLFQEACVAVLATISQGCKSDVGANHRLGGASEAINYLMELGSSESQGQVSTRGLNYKA